jgi:hypothetical protein
MQADVASTDFSVGGKVEGRFSASSPDKLLGFGYTSASRSAAHPQPKAA